MHRVILFPVLLSTAILALIAGFLLTFETASAAAFVRGDGNTATTEQSAPPTPSPKDQPWDTPTPREVAAAKLFRPNVEGKFCVEAFKTRMNDPTSLQIAGSWFQYHQLLSDEDAKAVSPAVEAGLPWRPTVTFGMNIRARNAFGGLILTTLTCSFYLRDEKLAFESVDTSN